MSPTPLWDERDRALMARALELAQRGLYSTRPNPVVGCVIERDGQVLTAGGRVLCVTALGCNVKQAQKLAYETVAGIHFEGMQYRSDIGHRAAG